MTSSPSSHLRLAFWDGVVRGMPFIIMIVPFALLFGVVGTEAGLNLVEVVGFSMLVVGGSAQFTAVQLMTENAPTVVIVLAALAVNMRMAMYSASLVPHIGGVPLWQRAVIAYLLVDQTYAIAIDRYSTGAPMTPAQKVAFYFGAATMASPFWFAFTYVGAVAGSAIPPAFALDFALPVAFLALVAPALRTLPHVAAALTSVAGTLALSWVPLNLGLIIAACAALLVGAVTEIWLERRAAAPAGPAT